MTSSRAKQKPETKTQSARVGVDVGGTFVDVVSMDERTGLLTIDKESVTPGYLAQGVLTALERLPHAPASITRLFLGSTVALNAILEGKGARVGLLTTEGFRDVLELGRGERRDIYDWVLTPPEPLVPRRRRREVRERISADGSVLVPIDMDGLDTEVDRLVAMGAEAIALCFLHSYANPKHEALASERIQLRYPDLSVSASFEVAAEWREFERTATTVLNAFVQPRFGQFLADLTEFLAANSHERTIGVMQSNGGAMDSERATRLPIRTVMSGPAGGAIGTRELAGVVGISDVICADVGGTSFDVTLIEDGQILEKSASRIAGFPVLAPFIDTVSVGSGGGSIAWIDPSGSLRVGPQSAGAHPGPACFGRSGTEPTVTDAQLVLGRLDPERFLGSRLPLDASAAESAIADRIAGPLNLSVEGAAAGIVRIAEAAMASAIRVITVERGIDPRRFVLASYGGAGGFFAAAVAQELGISRVLVPRAAANFSAWGILASDYRDDAVLTMVQPLEVSSAGAIRSDLEALGRKVTEVLLGYGFEPSRIELNHRVDLRFIGQEHTISVPVEVSILASQDNDLIAHCRDEFASLHRQLYGHGDHSSLIEVVATRCMALGRVERPRWPDWETKEPGTPRDWRPAFFDAPGVVEVPVYDRPTLAVDQVVEGPAIIEEWTTTILVPPGWSAATDSSGTLMLELE